LHKVEAFIYRTSLEKFPVANFSNKTGDVFDFRTRKEALDFLLKKHKNKLWYTK
jgi:hypothetical protein